VDARALERGGDVHGRVVVRPGGTSANAAVWAAWDGAAARVHGGVGDDLAGRLLEQALRERGVKMHLTRVRGASTGTMLVVHEAGERSMVADRGANASLCADDLPGSLVSGAVLVSGYLLVHEDTHLAARAALTRAVAPFVAVEAASWPLLEPFGIDRFFDATAEATVLLANEREAETLTGATGDDAAALLGERFPVACVKRGAQGALAFVDGVAHHVPAEPVREVDPTGAGDAFDGVFLGALARGAGIDDALARACHAGALAAASTHAWPEGPVA
jgi:sugar/nucleoside kinase (ribokinase family)